MAEENSENGFYFTAVVYEGYKSEYTNNHIEGFKTTLSNVSLYDAYLSSFHVVSRNNLFKNNIIASEAAPDNSQVLLKSKGYPMVYGSDATRFYENNIYIIEEEWVKKVTAKKSASTDNICCYLYQANYPMQNFEIKNCYVDVYWLHIIEFNCLIKEVFVENNFFSAKYLSGYLVGGYFDENYGKKVFYKNNTYIAKEKNKQNPFGEPLKETNIIYLLPYSGEGSFLDNLEIKGNKFKLYNVNKAFRTAIPNVLVNNFIFTDNELSVFDDNIIFSPTLTSLAADNPFSVKNFICENNSFNNGN